MLVCSKEPLNAVSNGEDHRNPYECVEYEPNRHREIDATPKETAQGCEPNHLENPLDDTDVML